MIISDHIIATDFSDTFTKLVPGVTVSDEHGFVFVHDATKDKWIQIDCSLKDELIWDKVGEKSFHKRDYPPEGMYKSNHDEIRNFDDEDEITPGVIHDPKCHDHGALFVYDWDMKIWKEFDYSEKKITDEWRLVEND